MVARPNEKELGSEPPEGADNKDLHVTGLPQLAVLYLVRHSMADASRRQECSIIAGTEDDCSWPGIVCV